MSSSFSEHLNHLKEILRNLLINNLVINPTKTSVAYPEIEYLGYIINQHGIRISESKVKAIKVIQPQRLRNLYKGYWVYCSISENTSRISVGKLQT